VVAGTDVIAVYHGAARRAERPGGSEEIAMRKMTVLLALLVWATAGIVSAELSPKYKEWMDGPVGFLATKAEKKEYARIETDAEAQKFIDLFWAKRDPDLTTKTNEFEEEFDRRVGQADKLFSYDDIKGSMTDRGRMLILVGPPNEESEIPSGVGKSSIESRMNVDKGNTDVWVYHKDRLPPGVKQDDVYVYFRESRLGSKDFVLDRSDRHNVMAMKIEGDAPELYLAHPDLTEVPQLGLLPNSKPATAEQLALLSKEPKPWPEGSGAIAREGIASGSLHPLWVLVRLPDGVPAASQAVGRVRAAEGGEEAGTFAVDVTPIAVQGGRAYEFAFPVGAGSWDVDVALLGDAGPIAVRTIEGKTEEVPADGTYISPFYWGVDVRKDSQAPPGAPFTVGGWHVIPRPSNDYQRGESLSYFAFVLRPGADAEGKPKATVSLTLFYGSKKVSAVPPQPMNLSHIAGDVWMLGSGLPLSGFHRPGEYRLDVTLHDTTTDASRTAQIPITLPAPPASPAPAPTASSSKQ
jgi:GWxTD domain-containing protein